MSKCRRKKWLPEYGTYINVSILQYLKVRIMKIMTHMENADKVLKEIIRIQKCKCIYTKNSWQAWEKISKLIVV